MAGSGSPHWVGGGGVEGGDRVGSLGACHHPPSGGLTWAGDTEGIHVAFQMGSWHMFRLREVGEEKQWAGEASIGTGLFMNGGGGAG